MRAASGAIGVFILVNLIGEAVRPPFETLHEWLSYPSPRGPGGALWGALATVLLASSVGHRWPPLAQRVRAVLISAFAVVAAVDTARFYAALAHRQIHTPALLPASLFLAVFLGALVRVADALKPAEASRSRLWPPALAVAMLLAVPLLRIATFGPTRYDRVADCAVVFGARVWNDGTPSDALADRVDEAVRLYRDGRVTRIVMSGGVEAENGLSEPEVMRARAVASGVPEEAILIDEGGVDTASTVHDAATLMRQAGLASALIVTHYYHEPRAAMLFGRAGVRAFPVPARMTRRLFKEPYFLAREVAAFWHSFLFE